MKKLRWGLLSTARINQALLPPLRSSARNELTAVASRDLDRAQAYADERNIPRVFGSYEAMLADPDIDVIYNPLPNSMHTEWTIKAAEAGKHVLCEKPLANTIEEVDAITDAAKKAGVVVMEAFMYRHHPQTLKVKELVGDQGTITVKLPFTPKLNEEIIVMNGDEKRIITIPGEDLYLGEVENMADAILEGKAIRMSLTDSRNNVATIQALLCSAQARQPITM